MGINIAITGGQVEHRKRVAIYGVEGIGKTTAAAQFPNPVFIDLEGGTKTMNVARLTKPTAWEDLLAEIRYVISNRPCKTLVIDTVDRAEELCIKFICEKGGKKGIEDFGYGNGWVYEKEEFERFLKLLDEVIDADINIVMIAHAAIRKFEQPDEMGSYDRYEMKLGKKTTNLIAPLIKEWADMVLFANYKTFSVAADDKGTKHKAQGGKRVMYTSHSPCWDAKNRYGLPYEIPMDYDSIRQIIEDTTTATANTTTVPSPQVEQLAPVQKAHPREAPKAEQPMPEVPEPSARAEPVIPDGIPQALADLMRTNKVSEADIRKAVASKHYYPEDMPITDYPSKFINGCLIGAWDQVYKIIQDVTYPF